MTMEIHQFSKWLPAKYVWSSSRGLQKASNTLEFKVLTIGWGEISNQKCVAHMCSFASLSSVKLFELNLS